jgi:hypothetical protein
MVKTDNGIMREIIYGVFDKTYGTGIYMGFFKNEDDAKKEMQIQMKRLETEHGTKNLVYKDDRVVIENKSGDDIIFIIHSYVLR